MKEQIPGPSYHTKEHFSIRMQVLPIIHLNQRPNATDKGNFFFFFFKINTLTMRGKLHLPCHGGFFLCLSYLCLSNTL